MRKLAIKIFFIFFTISNSVSSEILKYPLPDILNYSPSINGGFAANWDITQGKDGKLYFANGYGVLIYDGKTWNSVILDNKDSARSIDVDLEGNIIVGSRGNVGFISNDGQPRFVVDIDPDTYNVVLGLEEDLMQTTFCAKKLSFTRDFELGSEIQVTAKIRYKANEESAKVRIAENEAILSEELVVK